MDTCHHIQFWGVTLRVVYLRTGMHHDHAALDTTSLHCVWVLIYRVIVIWTWLWGDIICYSCDVLIGIPWCYWLVSQVQLRGLRGELGWTHCMYLSLWAVYIYSVYCESLDFSWVQVVVLGDGWCGRSICVLYSLLVFSVFLRVPVDFGTHPCFYTIV